MPGFVRRHTLRTRGCVLLLLAVVMTPLCYEWVKDVSLHNLPASSVGVSSTMTADRSTSGEEHPSISVDDGTLTFWPGKTKLHVEISSNYLKDCVSETGADDNNIREAPPLESANWIEKAIAFDLFDVDPRDGDLYRAHPVVCKFRPDQMNRTYSSRELTVAIDGNRNTDSPTWLVRAGSDFSPEDMAELSGYGGKAVNEQEWWLAAGEKLTLRWSSEAARQGRDIKLLVLAPIRFS